MSQISASDVKALRESTGAGMMDCKRALSDAGGDTEKAMELLRERGLAKAGKRAGRETSEGAIAVALGADAAAIVELGCETDFVAKTDAFQDLANELARIVVEGGARDVGSLLAAPLGDGTVESRITETISKVGENIALKRVERLEASGGSVGAYVHAGGKLGVVVALSGAGGLDAVAKDVSMHVAAHDPTPIAVSRDQVPAEVVSKERDLLAREAAQSGKPEKVIEKIVDGRINKFFAENCLLEQAFVKDPDKTVGDLVKEAGAGIQVAAFARFKLGEGSEG